MPDRNFTVRDIEPAKSRLATAAIAIGCLVTALIVTATPASAHVKWFVPCNPADQPLPLNGVLTTRFWLFTALFLSVFSVGCVIEKTAIGAFLSKLLDNWTEPLHRQADVLLRAVTAVSFALLWADGSVILTPELKGSGIWLSAIQVLIAIFVIGRATLPAAAAGIVALYAYGIAAYGIFHMLDYPVFLGLAAYFALSVSRNAKLHAIRFDVVRCTVALSLLWPAMEKFLYPAWIAPIAIEHPELTLGIDVATVITAAGVVEFGLSFALLWTPLVRRLAALALALLLFAATFDFGKVDGIGHLMIIAILLLVIADPGKGAVRYVALAPPASAAGLMAAISLYSGVHALYYGSVDVALMPLVAGAAFLGASLLCSFGWVATTDTNASAAKGEDAPWSKRDDKSDASVVPWPQVRAPPPATHNRLAGRSPSWRTRSPSGAITLPDDPR
jgi:hypothetical protein